MLGKCIAPLKAFAHDQVNVETNHESRILAETFALHDAQS